MVDNNQPPGLNDFYGWRIDYIMTWGIFSDAPDDIFWIDLSILSLFLLIDFLSVPN